MKKFFYFVFFLLLFDSNSYAVPNGLKSEVLEVCIVNEDVTIFQKWQDRTDGPWIKGPIIGLKKGQLLTVHNHKTQKNIPRWYATEKDYFPKKNTHFHIAKIDSDYGVKKIKDVIHCKKGDKKSLKSIKASIKKNSPSWAINVFNPETASSTSEPKILDEKDEKKILESRRGVYALCLNENDLNNVKLKYFYNIF